MDDTPFKRAIAAAGSIAALARAIGTSQQRLSYALSNGGEFPADLVHKAEAATGVPAHELRPDMFEAPPAKAEAA